MEEIIKKANSYLKTQDYLVIFSTSVRPIGFMKNSEIISITTNHFVILNQSGNKIKRFFQFNELTELSIQENTITLVFGKNTYSFESIDANQVVSNIKDVISHVLTVFEQQNIKIDNFNITPQKSQNGFSAECRLYNSISQYPNSDKYLNVIKQILIYMQPTVSLKLIKNPSEIIRPLLNVLPFSPYIQNLEIPKMNGIDTYEIIRSYFKNDFHLKHLLIEGEKTKYFSEFFSILKHNTYSTFLGHSFSNTELERNDLDTLYKYCTDKKIQSLGFHQAIKKENLNYFFTSFLTPELFDSLYILNLSGNPKIEIKKLLPRLRGISYLSLKDCQCEICEVLNYVPQMSRIKCIDLSHNKCSSTFNRTLSATLKFPPCFDTLIIDSVSFTSTCIIPFLSFIFNRFEHGLRLSISNLTTTDELWTQIFDFLSTSSFRLLVSLNWDKNRISPKLFSFLLKNPFFESLSLNSCLSASSSDSINSLGIFIQSSKVLKSLSVCGDEEKNLGSSLNSLLKMISSSKSLKFLNISYSKSGDSGLQYILNFISQPSLKIEKIVFDDSMPSKSETIQYFLKKASKLKDKIVISFPENDVFRLVQENKMSIDELSTLSKEFVISTEKLNGSKSSQKVQQNESYFIRPYNIYRYFEEDKFPTFVTQEEISIIANDRYLIDQFPDYSPKRNSRRERIEIPQQLQQQQQKATTPTPMTKNKMETLGVKEQDKRFVNHPKKQLQPTKKLLIKDDIEQQERSKNTEKRSRNQIDEISHQIFEFDPEKERKRLNKPIKQNDGYSSESSDSLLKLNTNKRHAQSLRRERKVPRPDPIDNQPNKNNNNIKEVPRRTRTQSTRVRRKVTKSNSSKRSENKEKIIIEKVDKYDNQDIIEKAKKRRGRSVDSINKDKNKQNQADFKAEPPNPKELVRKKTKNDDFEIDDYNFNSNTSSDSFSDHNKYRKNKRNNIKDDDDNDDLNVTAPILRGNKKSNAASKLASKKGAQNAKRTKKAIIETDLKRPKRDSTQNNATAGAGGPPTPRSEKEVLRTPLRRQANQQNRQEKETSSTKKKSSTALSSTSSNKKRITKKEFLSDDNNEDISTNDKEILDFIEPVKYKFVDWKFPALKANNNKEKDFWEKFKSKFDYENLVEI